MIPIFISWTKGLPQNEEALSLIREHSFVSGVETSGDPQDIIAMQEHGVKVSIHNPPYEKRFSIEDADLISYLAGDEGQHILKQNDIPITSLHLGYSVWYGEPYGFAELLERARRHIPQLIEVCPHPLVIEMTPLGGKRILTPLKPDTKFFSSPFLLNTLTNEFPINFLFDIAHMFVAGMNKINMGMYDGTIEDYFDELLKAAKGRTLQLHVNVPVLNNQGMYDDKHRLFSNDSLSKKILSLTKRVVQASPDLKLITLEMNSKQEPLEHTKILLKQAELLHEYLYKSSSRASQVQKKAPRPGFVLRNDIVISGTSSNLRLLV